MSQTMSQTETLHIDRGSFGMDLPAAADMTEIAARIQAEVGDDYEIRVGHAPAGQDTPEDVFQQMLEVVSGYLDEMSRTYRITSSAGVNLGTYEAETEQGALDAMARDAGYESQADATARGVAPFAGTVEAL